VLTLYFIIRAVGRTGNYMITQNVSDNIYVCVSVCFTLPQL